MSDTTLVPDRKPMTIRFTEDEHAKLEAIAAMWGLSLAATIRRLIREKKVSQ